MLNTGFNERINDLFKGKHYDRRKFLNHAGKGVFAAGFMGGLTSLAATPSHNFSPGENNIADTTSVKLKPLDAPSEKQKGNPPAPLEDAERVGFAIVGLGHLALNQILPAFAISKLAKPVALVSGNAVKAKKVAEQYNISANGIYNYQNFDDIKNNPAIQAVYIVLPNGMHEEFTVRAANAAKHVLCEKPMANSAAEAQRMIDACKKAGKKLMIAYRIQYEPKNSFVMKWAREKTYGKVKLIEALNTQNIGDPTQWRLNKKLAGGGSLPDIGLYCLNTSRFLLGEEPNEVLASTYATPNDPRFKEVEEAVMFQLRFPSGALANCTTSYGVHESRRYRCLADNGGWFGLDPAFPYKGLKIEASHAEGNQEYQHFPSIEEKDQFAPQLDHFVQCITDNKQPYTPGEEGMQDQKIMEAIYQSAKEGKPVKLESITTMDTFRGTPSKEDS